MRPARGNWAYSSYQNQGKFKTKHIKTSSFQECLGWLIDKNTEHLWVPHWLLTPLSLPLAVFLWCPLLLFTALGRNGLTEPICLLSPCVFPEDQRLSWETVFFSEYTAAVAALAPACVATVSAVCMLQPWGHVSGLCKYKWNVFGDIVGVSVAMHLTIYT